MAQESAADTSQPTANQWHRDLLALIVVVASLLGVAVLGAVGIYKGEPAKEVLTMLLPVIGTWVGTVLAFYFGKEQLEAANRTVDRLARQLTSEEKLRSIKVTEKMIPRSDAFVATQEPSELKLLEVLSGLEKQQKGNRLPMLTQQGQPRYVVHRSTIDRFIAKRAAAGATTDDLQKLTMADLIKDPEFGKNLQNTFAVVPKSGTLADAKRAMDALQWCQDVFVTEAGTNAETVLGWVTNGIIEANSRV
ncbi:MAG TPA: hypothetical protein VMU45_03375 [Candidatus Eisenbacteria bacterium]|nr:hypothetical protein [Candidatus Eisenbacteria bacterium]